MEKKKDRKKLLVIALFLFAVIGLTGYGAYSYYATQGSFDTERATSEDDDNVIRITGSFNPVVDGTADSNSGNGFLGEGGTIDLDCPETSGGHETITCTASVQVRNEGSTGITVEVEDGSSSANVESGNITVSAENPSFNWSENRTTISAGQSETLGISVDVNVGSSSEVSDDNEVLVDTPVAGGEIKASVSFRLVATQNH